MKCVELVKAGVRMLEPATNKKRIVELIDKGYEPTMINGKPKLVTIEIKNQTENIRNAKAKEFLEKLYADIDDTEDTDDIDESEVFEN